MPIPPRTRSARVTTGLKCAPETDPKARISATSPAPVAIEFSSSWRPGVGAEPLGVDAGADHDGDEHPGADALGDETPGQLVAWSARGRGRGSGRRVDGRCRASRRPRRDQVADPLRSSTTAASNAAGVPIGTGSGIDQCSQPGSATPSSCARSHTVTTSAGRASSPSRGRGLASPRSSPARRAAATASGCTRSAGCVPAESAEAPVSWRHKAAAIWERAEFCVHTNSAGSAGSAPEGQQVCQRAAPQMDVAPSAVPRGPGAGDQPVSLQHVEVVGEQVRRQLDEGLQLARHPVGDEQLVDDREPHGIAQRRVRARPRGDRRVHRPHHLTLHKLSQSEES